MKTARYLREAIVDILDLEPKFREPILSSGFKKPRGPLGVDTYVTGDLLGDPEKSAPDGASFPYLEWKYSIKDVHFDESSQRYSYEPSQKFTARIGEETKLKNLRIQIWDASSFWPEKEE